MPYAQARGGPRVFYDVIEPAAGAADRPAENVVLIQGLGLSSRFWFDLPARLAADRDDAYRVIVLDNRGVGRSQAARPPYRMGALADDVAAVLDAAGVRRAFVVGISMGGMIAQHVAIRHPDRVEGLVLLATGPGLPHGQLPSPKTLRILFRVGARRASSRDFARLLLPEKHLDRAPELLARWPEAMRAEPVSPTRFIGQLLADGMHSTGFSLEKIRAPTMVVTGDDDLLIPPANSVVLARKIPDAELHVLTGVGHAIPLLDEDVVARFLRRLRARRAMAEAATKSTPG